MTTNPPALKRTLFGYRPETVRQLLSGRDAMFSRAQERLREQEGELAQIRAELQEVRSSPSEIQALRDQLTKQAEATRAAEARANQLEASARSLREQLRQRDETPQAAAPSLAQELSSALDGAEETFRRLLEQARTGTQAELGEVARARRELDEDTERLSAWRNQVVVMIRAVREAVVSAQAHAQQVPERIRAALTPTTDALTSVHDILAEFIRATEGHDSDRPPDRSAQTVAHPPAEPQRSTETGTPPEGANGESLPRDFGLQ